MIWAICREITCKHWD